MKSKFNDILYVADLIFENHIKNARYDRERFQSRRNEFDIHFSMRSIILGYYQSAVNELLSFGVLSRKKKPSIWQKIKAFFG